MQKDNNAVSPEKEEKRGLLVIDCETEKINYFEMIEVRVFNVQLKRTSIFPAVC